MAAAFTPTRKYGLHGDTCYFTQTMITEDGDHIWQVVVMKDRGDFVAGEYWYEESQLVVLPTLIDLPTADTFRQLETRGRVSQENEDLDEIEEAILALEKVDPCQTALHEDEALSIVLAAIA